MEVRNKKLYQVTFNPPSYREGYQRKRQFCEASSSEDDTGYGN